MNEFKPDYKVHPSKTVKEILDIYEKNFDYRFTDEEVAKLLDISVDDFKLFMEGKRPVDTKLAEELQSAFKLHQSFWLNMQALYDQKGDEQQ